MPPYDFKFLVWINQTQFFPEGFQKDLISLGVDEYDARHLAMYCEFSRKADVLQFWQDYGRRIPDHFAPNLFNRFMEMCWQKYTKSA